MMELKLLLWGLLAFIVSLVESSDSSSCHLGYTTPGYTIPYGDIIIEEGRPLEIYCVLNSDAVAAGNTASNLMFYEGDNQVSDQYISVINETTIRLYIDHPSAKRYIYLCKLMQVSKLRSVCVNQVIIGNKPKEVQNFNCISQNWESLTCNWNVQENKLKTQYKIYFNLPGRTRKIFNATCPTDTDIRKNTCTWSQSTTPIYRQPYEYYFFHIIGYNELATIEFPEIKFYHYKNVIPHKPINLRAFNITSSSVDLTWSISSPMTNFPPGLTHKVEIKSELDDNWKVVTYALRTSGTHITYHIEDLHEITSYSIRVFMKSTVAEGDDKWSPPSTITIRTQAAATTPESTDDVIISDESSLEDTSLEDKWLAPQVSDKHFIYDKSLSVRVETSNILFLIAACLIYYK